MPYRNHRTSDELITGTASSDYIDGATQARHEKLQRAVAQRQRGLLVMMEDVYNPHNLAAVARSCDAFGVQQVAFTLQGAENFDPDEVGRVSSSSASKWLDYRIFEHGSLDAIHTLRQAGYTIVASALTDNAVSLYEVDFTAHPAIALLLGNERAGLSEQALQHSDVVVQIPMLGVVQSFNVSVAASLLLYEITRQRRASHIDYTLDTAEQAALLHNFLRR